MGRQPREPVARGGWSAALLAAGLLLGLTACARIINGQLAREGQHC